MTAEIHILYIVYRWNTEQDTIEWLVWDEDDLEYIWSTLDRGTYTSLATALAVAELMDGKVGCFQAVLQKD
jgi:hypothetical protein